MSAWKAAVAGAVGFAVGAGAMLMPGNQKITPRVPTPAHTPPKRPKMGSPGPAPLHPARRAMGAQGSRGT